MNSIQVKIFSLKKIMPFRCGSFTVLGFIQTPGFGSEKYPPGMDSRVQIAVPLDHVTLVSIPRMFLHTTNTCDRISQADIVYLYKGGHSARDMVWKACGVGVPSPEVYDSRVLYVRFVSDTGVEASGFQLLYSFHKVGARCKLYDNQPCATLVVFNELILRFRIVLYSSLQHTH